MPKNIGIYYNRSTYLTIKLWSMPVVSLFTISRVRSHGPRPARTASYVVIALYIQGDLWYKYLLTPQIKYLRSAFNRLV